MKKIILLALTALVMVGCVSEQERDEFLKQHERFLDFQVVVVDSCEYVYRYSGSSGMAAHKGNCRFCKERRQKELEELVSKLKEE